ncbi:hypothetical protein D3C85_1351320 [compost metagenome]
MVALDRVEPRPRQPFQRGLAFRAAVDQVAHGKQPVAGWIETQPVQALLQPGKMPMHIAHRVVAAGFVARDFKKTLLHDDSELPLWKTDPSF